MRLVESLRRQYARVVEKRTGRERVALKIMLVTVAGAIWFQLLWSAHHARVRYSVQITELLSRNEAMRQAAASMRAVNAQGVGVRPISAEKAVTVFTEGLRSSGFPGLAVLPDTQGKVRLVGNAEFDAWIAWLAKVHAEFGAQALRASIELTEQPGIAKIDAILALPEVR